MTRYRKIFYDHIYPKSIFSSTLFICGLCNNTSPSIKTDLKEAAGDAVKKMQQQATGVTKYIRNCLNPIEEMNYTERNDFIVAGKDGLNVFLIQFNNLFYFTKSFSNKRLL